MFKVKLHEIKKKELPEPDDDFASEVSEFETFEEYKKSVRERLEKAAEERTKDETETAAIEAAADNMEVDIPNAMIEAQIDRMINDFAQRLAYQGMNLDTYIQYTGSSIEAMRESFRDQAGKQVRVSLLLEAIVKEEGIEANPEEIEDKIVEMSKNYNMEPEKLKEVLRPADNEAIQKEIEFTKAMDIITNNAVVK